MTFYDRRVNYLLLLLTAFKVVGVNVTQSISLDSLSTLQLKEYNLLNNNCILQTV